MHRENPNKSAGLCLPLRTAYGLLLQAGTAGVSRACHRSATAPPRRTRNPWKSSAASGVTAEAQSNLEELMTTLRVLCEKWRHGRVIAVAVTLLALSAPAVAQQAAHPWTRRRSTARHQGGGTARAHRISVVPVDRAERRRTARRRYDRGAARLRRRVRAGHDQWRRRAGDARVSGGAARRLRPERQAHRPGAGQLRPAHRIEPAQSDDVGSGRSHGRQHDTRACDVGRHHRSRSWTRTTFPIAVRTS